MAGTPAETEFDPRHIGRAQRPPEIGFRDRRAGRLRGEPKNSPQKADECAVYDAICITGAFTSAKLGKSSNTQLFFNVL